jgi:glucan phosphorylase
MFTFQVQLPTVESNFHYKVSYKIYTTIDVASVTQIEPAKNYRYRWKFVNSTLQSESNNRDKEQQTFLALCCIQFLKRITTKKKIVSGLYKATIQLHEAESFLRNKYPLSH